VALNAGNLDILYSNVSSSELITLAALTVSNPGDAAIQITQVVPERARGVGIVGVYVADRDAYPPGAYRTFPPVPRLGLEPLHVPRNAAPLRKNQGALILVEMRLNRGADAGTISTVRISYRTRDGEYSESFPDPALLCKRQADTDATCDAAFDAAKRPTGA
jgi:hypothetical protein